MTRTPSVADPRGAEPLGAEPSLAPSRDKLCKHSLKLSTSSSESFDRPPCVKEWPYLIPVVTFAPDLTLGFVVQAATDGRGLL